MANCLRVMDLLCTMPSQKICNPLVLLRPTWLRGEPNDGYCWCGKSHNIEKKLEVAADYLDAKDGVMKEKGYEALDRTGGRPVEHNDELNGLLCIRRSGGFPGQL